jgi:hypothetical protein
MKLRDAILLSLAVGFMIIGINEIMTVGFAKGYWAVMISLIAFFAFSYLKRK